MFHNRPPFSFSLGAWVALLLGVALSVALFLAAREFEHDRARTAFEQQAEFRIQAVRRGMQWSVNELVSVNQLFVAFGDVSREQFRHFTAPLLRRNPYIQAFNFHRIISDAERPQFEARMRRFRPTFSITEGRDGKMVPAARRPQYRVVEYIEPLEGNETALGFDSASYSFQTEAMRRAAASGQPTATGLLRLMQETANQAGLLVLMPLYRPGAPLDSEVARHAALFGDTAAVFRIGDLVENALAADMPRDAVPLRLKLFLNQPDGAPALAYRSAGVDREARAPLVEWLFYDQPAPLAKTFEIAGRSWTMVVSAPSAAPISPWSSSVLEWSPALAVRRRRSRPEAGLAMMPTRSAACGAGVDMTHLWLLLWVRDEGPVLPGLEQGRCQGALAAGKTAQQSGRGRCRGGRPILPVRRLISAPGGGPRDAETQRLSPRPVVRSTCRAPGAGLK